MKQALIGIDLGGTNIKSVLLDALTSRVINRLQVGTQAACGVKAVVANIVDAIRQQLAFANDRRLSVIAVGIGSAGLVDKGVVRNSPNLPGWQGAVPLLRLLKKELRAVKLPIVIDNDANSFVAAEQRLGAARGATDVVGLTLGTGVGGGIIVDGRLYRGASGGAGELGHAVICKDGPKCLCGNRGCLEAFVGAGAIIARYRALKSKIKNQKSKITVAQIAEWATHGDRDARTALRQTGILLGVALANYANIFNPAMIVIGGGVAQAGRLIIGPAAEEMKRRAMPHNARCATVKQAKLGPWAGAIGAALIAGDSRASRR